MKAIPTELEAKIDEINLWMFEGDRDKVAAMSRKSREWVSKVLHKKAFNSQILDAAIQIMNENKARFECKPSMKIA